MNIRPASLAAIGPIVRAGTIRSSAAGARPYTRSQCDSFHAARIFASVGCTGTRRVASVYRLRPSFAPSAAFLSSIRRCAAVT